MATYLGGNVSDGRQCDFCHSVNTCIATSRGRGLLENGAGRRKNIFVSLKMNEWMVRVRKIPCTHANEYCTSQKPFPRQGTLVFVIFVKKYRPLVPDHCCLIVTKPPLDSPSSCEARNTNVRGNKSHSLSAQSIVAGHNRVPVAA